MYSVYALVDPRDQAIRYIGMSKNVWRRYAMHLLAPTKAALAKNAWIEELRQIDLSPLLNIIETATTEEEASRRETYWIRYYLNIGARLLNVAKTGLPISEPGKMTASQVAKRLALTPSGASICLRTGAIPGGYKVKGLWRIDEPDLEKFIADQKRKASQKED